MADDKTKVDEFLGDLGNESNLPDSFLDVSVNNQEDGQTGATGPTGASDDRKVPFHKDQKIQRYVKKEIEKALSGFNRNQEPSAPQHTEENSFKDVVESFKTIIGDDTPEKVKAIMALEKSLINLDEKAAQKAIESLQEEREQELQEEQEAEDELLQGFEEIEDTFDVDISSDDPNARKLRSQYINFVRKIAPKNSDGEVIEFPDFVESFDTFQSTLQKESSTPKAKELASRASQRSGGTTINPQIEDKSWNAVERIFDRFTGK